MPKLTDALVAKLQVPAGRRDVLVFDDAVPGFGVRKFASGEACYFVKYSLAGKPRRLTLGNVREKNLKAMRDLAEEVKARAKLGQDVLGDQKAKAAEQEAAETAATVGALIEVFLREREETTRTVQGRAPTLRLKTHEQSAKYLRQHCQRLHRLVVGTVVQGAQAGVVDVNKRWTAINGHKLEIAARSHVVAVIDDVAKTRGKVSADRCKTALSTFFAWAIDQGYCDGNPSMHIKSRAGKVSRSRVLTDIELAAIWRACAGSSDFDKIVRLLLLTGQRRVEIGDLKWSELDLVERVIRLPPPRVKNNRAFVISLSDDALAIIKSVPRSESRDLLFGRGSGGFGGWGLAKVALDKRLPADMPHWTIHDLRRSFSTHANTLGLGPPWIIEAVLNHVVGGVAGTYNRAEHEAGKRDVLEKWGRYIAGLVADERRLTHVSKTTEIPPNGGTPAKVTPTARAKVAA